MKGMKFFLIIITVVLLCQEMKAQVILPSDTPSELNLDNTDRCFVFSSIDWFDVIITYDSNMVRIDRINVKDLAKKNDSQLVFLTYDFVYDAYCYFVFKGSGQTKYVRFYPDTQNYHYISKSEFKNAKKRHIK